MGGLAALAISASAHATLVTYGGVNSNTSSLTVASAAIDLGSVVSSFAATATLGFSLTSPDPVTLSTLQEGLQVVQGCAKVAALCGAADWTDITGKSLPVGGTSFVQTTVPTEVHSFTTGSVLVSGVSVESLRVKFDAGSITPAVSQIAFTGSLEATTAPIPEPSLWLMTLGGISLLGWLRLRKSEELG